MPEISKIINTPIGLVDKIGKTQKATISGIFPTSRQYTMPSSTKIVTYADDLLKIDGSTSSFNVSQNTQLIFDLSDSSNSGHPFTLATANDESTNYTNVTSSGTPGNAGATLTTTLPLYANNTTLWWYCSSHGSEGGSFAILEPPPPPGPDYTPEFMYNPHDQDIEIDGTTYTIGGGLESGNYPGSQNVGWGGYSMGSQFEVMTDGLILGVGVHVRPNGGSYFRFYQVGNSTALFQVDNVSVGNLQYSGNWNYKYHILDEPYEVSSGTQYMIMHKNSGGGYAYDSANYGTANDTGNLKWRGGRFYSSGHAQYGHHGPYTTSYGAADVIFTPTD